MELLKKTIKQAVTTGTTSGCSSNCYVIIPDLSATYYINIMLSQKVKDLGFFDVYDDNDEEIIT